MIDVHELTKRYGDRLVVDNVSFRCEPGTVTGFLGPNGAGKSTTLRLLCGLGRPTSGEALVGGVPYRELPDPGRRVGVLLDASAQHGGRTGREVLALSAAVLRVDADRWTRCSTRSGWLTPPVGGSAVTRWACASGWASRTRCSAIPRC